MIRLGGLVSQKAFGKFEMGKVISNPFATAFIKEGEGEDHEVSMANNSIDTIIKMATELKAKMGEDEKQIPAWIQDHIAKAENLISQASGNYHEYGDSNESVNEAPAKLKQTISKKEWSKIPKYNKHIGMDGVHYIMKYDDKIGTYLQGVQIVDESVNEDNTAFETLMLIRNLEQTNKLLAQDLKTSKRLPNDKKENIKKSIVVNQGLINYYKETYKNLKSNETVNEASPCWKGYKQVGMKDKGGRQVPNCVPNESVVNEAPNTGERIQNLNNRIKVLRDKISATKSPEQKKLFSDRLKNALQSLSNIKKDHSIKAPHRESVVKEAVAPKDMDKIKSAVEAASSFMGVGSELKKLGMKYTFATEPLAIYIVQPTPNNKVAIVNKRYVSKPDFVVGDIAVGVMEGVNEISSKTPKIFVKTAAVEKKIKELMADRKKAVVPYNSETDPAKKEKLKQILIKLTNQIKGYENNLVKLRDMEEEYLQQMHADAELDTTGL